VAPLSPTRPPACLGAVFSGRSTPLRIDGEVAWIRQILIRSERQPTRKQAEALGDEDAKLQLPVSRISPLFEATARAVVAAHSPPQVVRPVGIDGLVEPLAGVAGPGEVPVGGHTVLEARRPDRRVGATPSSRRTSDDQSSA